MKKCIVSFSAVPGRENYAEAQLRLISSCVKNKWDGEYLMRTYGGYCPRFDGVEILRGHYPITKAYGECNNHAEVPYGFKPYIMLEAIEKGYQQIVWCDSTIVMARNIEPLLAYANKYGVAAFDNLGHPLLPYLTDLQQERLKITDKELYKGIKQIMACVIVFDVSNKNGALIFDKWLKASRDGVSFQNGYGSKRPEFKTSRHDQSYLSGLLYNARIPLLPYGNIVYEPHDQTPYEYGKKFYFINKGLQAWE